MHRWLEQRERGREWEGRNGILESRKEREGEQECNFPCVRDYTYISAYPSFSARIRAYPEQS